MGGNGSVLSFGFSAVVIVDPGINSGGGIAVVSDGTTCVVVAGEIGVVVTGEVVVGVDGSVILLSVCSLGGGDCTCVKILESIFRVAKINFKGNTPQF
jgi:hypothetical protein